MASLTSTIFKERFLTIIKENGTLNATCQEIAIEIQSGHAQLYAIVEELGPFLTEKDVSIRDKGINILSTVLSYLPNNFLNEAELHFITSFYCDRLKDHHSIIPAVLKGILAIVQMNHLPKDSPERLLRVFFDNVQCQSQSAIDRYNIYLILTTLLQNKIEDLKAMGPDFLYGMISTIEGERDPRNLMLIFTILPHFMKEFPLGHLTEEMFEVIACYFPVDFNPSGSDGLKITRDDLAEKLAPCLCAIPEFSEYCIPTIIEKLFSSLKVAKMDSLYLLCKGAQTFGIKALERYSTELWPLLKKEIIPGGDVELRNASLKAVMSMIEVLSADTKICEIFIDDIITDTKSSLYDIELSSFRSSVKLLECIAMVNKESCIQVLRIIIPSCLGQYSTKTTIIDKVILTETLNIFIKIACDHRFNIKDVPELSWTDIPQLYLHELSTHHAELQTQLLLGLTLQKAYLNEVHRSSLYDKICSLSKTNSDEIKTICYASLLSFAILYPREISNLMKERFLLTADEENTEVQIHKLEVLTAVAKTYELGIEILPHIVSQTNVANSEISFAALTCLHRLVVVENIDYNIKHYLYNECNIIEKLAALKINPVDQRLNLVLNICRLIIRNLTFEEQQRVVNKYAIILNEQVSEIDAIFIMNIFIPLRQSIDLPINLDLFKNLYSLVLNNIHTNIKSITWEFFAVLLNKMNDSNPCFQSILSYFKNQIANDLKSNINIEIKQAAASLQVWLTKAIITKGCRDGEIFLNELTNILKHEHIGQYVAQEYTILTSKQENVLVEENFCNIKILFKQRVFEHLINKNLEFEDSSRQNYLTALVLLLEEIPVELLFMHLTKSLYLLTMSS
nr:PREDICTED: MMS19 nucleotide excision repair protein homolog isoform X2 [Megachile rotundata]